jgi:hypothetical protein
VRFAAAMSAMSWSSVGIGGHPVGVISAQNIDRSRYYRTKCQDAQSLDGRHSTHRESMTSMMEALSVRWSDVAFEIARELLRRQILGESRRDWNIRANSRSRSPTKRREDQVSDHTVRTRRRLESDTPEILESRFQSDLLLAITSRPARCRLFRSRTDGPPMPPRRWLAARRGAPSAAVPSLR